MFGVLEIAFGHHRIAGGLGVARELEVFFGDVMGGAPDLDVWSVKLIGPGKRVRPLAVTSTTTATRLLLRPRIHLFDPVSSMILE